MAVNLDVLGRNDCIYDAGGEEYRILGFTVDRTTENFTDVDVGVALTRTLDSQDVVLVYTKASVSTGFHEAWPPTLDTGSLVSGDKVKHRNFTNTTYIFLGWLDQPGAHDEYTKDPDAVLRNEIGGYAYVVTSRELATLYMHPVDK